ncbi:MAG: N-6 DNA methylase [Fimbriimonadaceae bacterium]
MSRQTGAPLAFTGSGRQWSVWQLTHDAPTRLWAPQRGSLDEFFQRHGTQLDPRSIYRAKTAARLDATKQLSFVDSGMLEMVESEAGGQLSRLVESMVLTTREKLHMAALSELAETDAQWLVQANFWLLAARLLHDKEVPGFKTLDLEDLDNVFARVGRHYGSSMSHPLSQKRRRALTAAAAILDSHSSLRLVSTETLARVSDDVLITKETRKALGTHSTPAWLVNYIVHRLTPWIEDQHHSRRHVYEPGCGHAPFLVALLRLFSGMKPCVTMSDEDRHEWLKARLCGAETDDFAREIGRISLTLTDIPNPNGWELDEGNMFTEGRMESRIKSADIIVSNPPFEPRASTGDELFHVGQAAELLRRINLHAKPGTLVAYIMPQTILDSRKTTALRKELLGKFEWQEILRLPDKVFEKADVETAVIIGRRLRDRSRSTVPVRIKHVWDGGLPEFKASGIATVEQKRSEEQMLAADDASMLVPDLGEVWDYCSCFDKLMDVATVGHGMIYISESKKDKNGKPLFPEGQSQRVEKRTKGYELGFYNLQGLRDCHVPPKLEWLNKNPAAVAAARDGFVVGIPQIVMNYVRIQRGPWRIKAFIDSAGRRACSDFLIVRPTIANWTLNCLWALLTSPIASAYAYSFSAKKHIYSSRLQKLPLPPFNLEMARNLDGLVNDYLVVARQHFPNSDGPVQNRDTQASNNGSYLMGFEPPDYFWMEEEIRNLRLRIDSLILQSYLLPARLERQVLDYFIGFPRPGVPFHQTEYYPRGFKGAQTLAELLAITADWEANNARRLTLIDKQCEGRPKKADAEELQRLQHLATLRRRLVAPYPMAEVDAEIARLKQEGKWTE